MTEAGVPRQFEIGIAGLDSSGRRLARALGERSLRIVAYDPDVENVKALREESGGLSIHIAASMTQFISMLRHCRTIVVSGSDAEGGSFNDLLDRLEAEDLLIDAGNCYFKDCNRRARHVAERNIRYLGMGIVEPEEGDKAGPVLFAGGRYETYERARAVLESMAVTKNGESRVSYLGAASASAHFVKMIHDGTEYGLLKTAREVSDLLKLTLGCDEPKLHPRSSAGWTGENGALWMSQIAKELAVPAPSIDAAVGLRALSEMEKRNHFATTLFRQPVGQLSGDPEGISDELNGALDAASMITCAQGLAVLAAGSDRFGFDIDLGEVVRLWKGCCCVRPVLMDNIVAALQANPRLTDLLYDDDLSEKVMAQQEQLRHAVWRAGILRMPVPSLMAALDYLDFHREAWLPGNLIDSPANRHYWPRSASSLFHSPRTLAAADQE